MTELDYIVLALIGISALVGVMRGFVREVMSLLTWILAFWVGFSYAPHGAAWLAGYIDAAVLRLAIAFIAFVLGTLIAGALVSRAVTSLVSLTGLGGTDRLLGVGFGMLRGVVIVAVVVVLGQMSPAAGEPWWQNSRTVDYLAPLMARLDDHRLLAGAKP